MTCACIKDIFDFYLESRNCCEAIYYQDQSYWMDESYDEYYHIPETYDITISTPSTTVAATVATSGLTKLDLSCEDGIYCFKVVNCDGVELSRVKLVDFEIQDKIACLLSTGDFDSRITEAKRWLEAAKINAERDKINTATEYYEMARHLIDELDCHCCPKK